MASIRHERTEHLAYALYNIPNQSNEDRCATFISHEREGLDSMASFGVFDGHMGASAADACSTQLHGMVALNSRQLSNVIVSKTQNGHTYQPPPPGCPEDTTSEGMLASYMQTLNQEDLRDMVVCEAIKRAVGELDGEVRRFSNAGTTVASLFLLWDTDDRNRTAHLNNGPAGRTSAPVRVYCANMGDSRCVMMRCYDTREALSLPSAFDSSAKRNGMSVETLGQQMAGMSTSDPAQSSAQNRFVAVHLMTEDHKLQLPRERYRINNTLPAVWKVLPADASPIFLPSYARTAPPDGFPGVSTVYGDPPQPDKFAAAAAGASNLSIVNNLPPITRPVPQQRNSSLGGSLSMHGSVFGSIKDNLSMSGHGNLESSASGKRTSIMGGFGFGRSNSGISASQHGIGSLHGNTTTSAHSEIKDDVGAQGFIFDWGYPPDSVMQAAQGFIRIAAEGVPQAQCAPGACDPNYARNMQAMQEAAAASMKGRASAPNKNVGFQLSDSQHGRSNKPMTVGEALKDSNYEPPLVNRGSFIQCRTSADGRTVGPEALFGRHNISIMMTRSVGDRYGARSCVAMPEVSAYTVPPNIHVRFVLGSDGFWDVVSVEDVRCVGMITTNSDPRMLAAQLAQKAHRRRDRAKIRMDDITVLVVDVNPNNFVGVSGKAGNDGQSSSLASSLAGRLGKGKWW